jgi:UDP-glucuronate decarboxylase
MVQNKKEMASLDRNVLISGGAGFLGSWLSETLIEQGLKIVCVDDLSTGLQDNISHLTHKTAFTFIHDKIERFQTKQTFDYVIHFSSRPSPDDYMAHPIDTLTATSQGTLNMLEIARKSDAPFFLASTSEVYGDAQVIPTPEEYWGFVNPVGVRSCYDEGKRFAESLTIAYQRQYDLDVRIMRIFNVYGPKMRADGLYGRVISIFLSQAIQGKPITIHGDGLQTRSFTYVTDWLEATVSMLQRPEAKGEIINVGNDVETSIIELANLIIQLTNSKSEVKFRHSRPDDPRRRRPDITKAIKLLKWKPVTPLENGLQKMIKWKR